MFLPIIEKDIFHCNTKIEFIHPYKNLPIGDNKKKESWLWHYDDCPSEYIKLIIYLNDLQ